MSNTERKARKRAGVKFERVPKVGTPLVERAWFNTSSNWDPARRAWVPASASKRQRALEARQLPEPALSRPLISRRRWARREGK